MAKGKKEKQDLSRVFSSRERTNILKKGESAFILYLVQRLPDFITSNVLTAIGLFGSVVVFLGFVLAKEHLAFLFLCPLGFFINWFGDSLDGRVAYYRHKPRKWYGFSLDIIMDWFSTVLIGFGYYFYAQSEYKIIAFIFVILYGWSMIMALLKYRITDQYTIDSGAFGPTELRIILSSLIVLEYFFPNTLQYLLIVASFILLVFNSLDMRTLLKLGDIKDNAEKKQKEAQLQEQS